MIRGLGCIVGLVAVAGYLTLLLAIWAYGAPPLLTVAGILSTFLFLGYPRILVWLVRNYWFPYKLPRRGKGEDD